MNSDVGELLVSELSCGVPDDELVHSSGEGDRIGNRGTFSNHGLLKKQTGIGLDSQV